MKQNYEFREELDLLSLEAQTSLKKTIQKEHPEFVSEDGSCNKCIKYYSSLSNLEEAIRQINH